MRRPRQVAHVDFKSIRNRLGNVFLENLEIVVAAVLAIILIVIVKPYFIQLRGQEGFKGNLLGEAFGFLSDIVVFGILLVIVNKRIEKKRDIKRWKEEIDDYRGWDEKEATYRIMGNIRRLNRSGITAIDLSFCCLKEAKLGKDFQGTVDRAEACLSPDMVTIRRRGNMLRIPEDVLRNEYIANLKGANLTKADLTSSILSDVNLEKANLYRAIMNGSYLFWANLSGANLRMAQLQYCSLGGATLQGANLMDADLTGARGLSVEQLESTTSLYRTKLDKKLEQEIRQLKPDLLEEPAGDLVMDANDNR